MNQHNYGDCSYCKGSVKAAKVKMDLWWKDRLYIFEDVPAGVCQQCGERYFTAAVAKSMESCIHKNHWKRFLEVPVTSYPQLTSA